MTGTVKLKAPAKINLRLEVVGKRRDGYHLLRMINIPVDLCDEVGLSLNRKGITDVSCSHPLVPSGTDNITVRAAKALMEKAGVEGVGLHIMLRKRIPVAAGLGGGSSDAAAVLKGVCRIMEIEISRKELEEMALGLGADVPFFMEGKPALVQGIGEVIEPIEKFPGWTYVIVTPDFQVGTAWVYRKFRMKKRKERPSNEEILRRLASGKAEKDFFINDLEDVVAKKYPIISLLKNEMIELGAGGSVMSGSGPSVAGVFEEAQAAQKAKAEIERKHPEFFCAVVSVTGQ